MSYHRVFHPIPRLIKVSHPQHWAITTLQNIVVILKWHFYNYFRLMLDLFQTYSTWSSINISCLVSGSLHCQTLYPLTNTCPVLAQYGCPKNNIVVCKSKKEWYIQFRWCLTFQMISIALKQGWLKQDFKPVQLKCMQPSTSLQYFLECMNSEKELRKHFPTFH